MSETVRKKTAILEEQYAIRCNDAKKHWQELAKANHENTYSASLRYELLREVAEVIASIGQALDNEIDESITVGWVCEQCDFDYCFASEIKTGDLNYCPKCGRKIEE